jgi:hypothetical protein
LYRFLRAGRVNAAKGVEVGGAIRIDALAIAPVTGTDDLLAYLGVRRLAAAFPE